MKIALIHYRMLLRGGLETRLFSYIEYLKNQGHEVTVIVSKISPDIQIPTNIRLIQLKHFKFPKFLKQYFFDQKLRSFMKSEKFDFSLSLGRTSAQDAVLAPGNHPGFLAATGKKFPNLSDRVQTFLDKRAYESSRIIFASSQMMKEEVIRFFGIDAERVKLLHPPIEAERFQLELKMKKAEYKSKFGFSLEKQSFLFVSTGHKRKGLPLLLDVFSQLNPEKFELIIAGNPAVHSKLSNVKFIGFVKETEELYAAANFTIHPSVYEPYGQIVAESILCGTPVLVSKMVGSKEIVTHENGIIVPDFSAESWIKAIQEAPQKVYNFHENFAAENGLLVEQHIKVIFSFLRTN